jgi:hypothetical protein
MYLLCVSSLILIPGGAERLVVDAAVGLQKLGHTVEIYTSHHDPAHCFDETRDGMLGIRSDYYNQSSLTSEQGRLPYMPFIPRFHATSGVNSTSSLLTSDSCI